MNVSLFDPACTAEQLVSAVDATYALGSKATVDKIGEFVDVVASRAQSICNLAVAMKLIEHDSAAQNYKVNHFARLLVTASLEQRAAILRVFLEEFDLFQIFRMRMVLDGSTDSAIRHLKTIASLSEHPAEIAQTLTSLGTYSGVLHKEHGAPDYIVNSGLPEGFLSLLGTAMQERANAERLVISRIGSVNGQPADFQSDVVNLLVDGAIHAARNESDQAIFRAGNAIDSFIKIYSKQVLPNDPLTGAGIGANVKQLAAKNPKLMPKKLSAIGYYLGHLRNAADHGQDSEVGQVWTFSDGLGISYVLVACDFIKASISIGLHSRYSI